MVEDYHDKFKNWNIPDKAAVIKRIKETLIKIHDSVIRTEDEAILSEARTQTERLRLKLEMLAGKNELDTFNSTMIVRIKTSIIGLNDSLDAIDPEDIRTHANTVRMINRQRETLLQMTSWEELSKLDVHIYTRRAGIA
jgi:hypothetical protein